MAYMPDVLLPRAQSEVANAAGRGRDLNDPAFIDEVAETLYKLHRGGYSTGQSKVQERSWATLPSSEKGKYRKMVQNVVHKFRVKK